MPGHGAGLTIRDGVVAVVVAALSAPASALALETTAGAPGSVDPSALALLNRVTWGVNSRDAAAIAATGPDRWLDAQLHPPAEDRLPPPVQAEIDALPYLHVPVDRLVNETRSKSLAANHIMDPQEKRTVFQANYKASMEPLHQAAVRSILRDIYSPDQLKEQMTWFWFNHFNVNYFKADVRLMVGDYEDQALRPHALGRFRDLLEATLRHPAMLRYLDNADNVAGHINENYAREIMELHTMGVDSGYSQGDVQALARILTGVGVDTNRRGLFAYDGSRHDHGAKVFLGERIHGRGFAEVTEALDRLARHPATARHISRELAVYFVSDDPPDSLIQRMSDTFLSSDGDIAAVLATMFKSSEFAASLGKKFKDPAHYVVSAVRLAYGDQVILDTTPIQAWITRLGEGLYTRETPDGFSMIAAAWDGPGQMGTRFEIARQIGSNGSALFKTDAGAAATPQAPALEATVQADGLTGMLAPATRASLARASSPSEWNALFLASPAFMRR